MARRLVSTHLLLAAALLAVPVACEPAGGGTTVPDSATTTVISLQQIDCQSCGVKVIADLKQNPAVYDASFDKVLAEVTVHYDAGRTGPEAFLQVIEGHGYEGVLGAGKGAYIAQVEFDPELDVQRIAEGSAVALADHFAPEKVTVFDFYAVWCKPCREVDHHMKGVLEANDDVAFRKLDVVDWDSQLAATFLKDVAALPYVEVYDAGGNKVAAISGLHLDQLDAAIAEARAR